MANDILFDELEDKMLNLSSDRQVNELVDLCNLVQSSVVSEFLVQSVKRVSARMHASRVLFLMKFVSLYAKRDGIFFKSIEKSLPQICSTCYENAYDKETLLLFIAGWKMRISPWPVIAASAISLIEISEHKQELEQVCDVLAGDFPNKIRQCLEHPKSAILLAEDRLDRVIEAINILHRIVVPGQ